MRHLTAPANGTLLPTLILAAVLGLLVTPLAFVRRQPLAPPAADTKAASNTPAEQNAREAFGRVPLSFEANRGQADPSVDFLARGAGYALFLKPSEAVFVLRDADSGLRIDEGRRVSNPQSDFRIPQSENPQPAIRNPQSRVLRVRLAGARAGGAASGENELEGRVNYLVGRDPALWRTNVSTYGRVRYAGVYPGVDVIYYGNQRQLEYDFRVAPGADPRAVALELEGADKAEVNSEGELLLRVGRETVRQPKPVIYQEAAGARREVAGGYAVGRDGRVRFSLGEYDSTLPLVIDPVIVYSTYLGGSKSDQANVVAVDSAGSLYVAGFTNSANFPTAAPLQGALGSTQQDAFVAKLNPAGTAFVYSTYLGGNAFDSARGLGVDSGGNACVGGTTTSTNFPTTNGAAQATLKGSADAFVAKLNAAGNGFVYSTYLGGGASESGEALAVDTAGNAYAVGFTNSTDFPTANAIQATNGGGTNDGFLTKLDGSGAVVYSTYLGGGGGDFAAGVAVDSSGNAYVAGRTDSANFPTANAIQANNAGGIDAFVTKINAAGNGFVYSTYLGGALGDQAQGAATDPSGNAYVTGQTDSTNFPVANAIQPMNSTSSGITQEAFVTKLNPAGSAFVYSTYLGGNGGDVGQAIAADSAGNAYVVGGTGTFNTFPTANALQCQRLGNGDPFVTKLNPAGTAFVYSTYYGGSASTGGEIARAVAVDSSGNAYVAGNTNSVDFPLVKPAQGAYAGDVSTPGDAFLFKLSEASAGPPSLLQFTQSTVQVQEDVTSVTLTVQRAGDTSGTVTVDYSTAPPLTAAASEKFDYTTALGTLRFAAGETSKTIEVLVGEDSYGETAENISVVLSNPTGGAALSCPGAVATVQITDDPVEPPTNAIDDPTTFVGQHYHDFLNRQADTTGLNFWANQIIACGADAACIDRTRTAVSQAFFLSIEFQNTGFYVFRIYKASFTDSAARPRGMPRYREFLRDQREVGRGVVVNQAGWEAVLDANKQEFARQWVQRPEFLAQFPLSMSGDEYVNKLAANSGVTLTPSEFNIAIESYTQTVEGRATTLRNVVELNKVYNRQFNAGFVLSQYIGYLRRNPNDFPELGLDYTGFDFWLNKLDSFSQPGENMRDPQTAQQRVQRAEMVRAFILSDEYRKRFGPQ
jgi:hypothetical protein